MTKRVCIQIAKRLIKEHQQNICHILCALNQCKCTIPVEPLEGTSTFRMLAQIDLPRGFGFVAIGVPIQGHFVVFALQKVLVLLTVMPKQLVVDYPFLLSCPRVAEKAVGCVEFSIAVGTYLKRKRVESSMKKNILFQPLPPVKAMASLALMLKCCL